MLDLRHAFPLVVHLDSETAVVELDRFLVEYNTDRPHQGRYTRGRIPEDVLGKAKVFTAS